jgi:hypothetical protein
MPIRTSLAIALALAAAAPAFAARKVVAVVHAASAEVRGGVLEVDASVDLPNTCWSNPRFGPVPHHPPDASGALTIEVVATSTEAPGRACGMVYRPAVSVPALRWPHPPRGLHSLNVVGSRTPASAIVVWPATPPPRGH